MGDTEGPHNTWVEDGLLYWGYFDGGLRVLDLSDPVHPVAVGHFRKPYAWGAQPHEDGLIYVADAHLSALWAVRFDRPAFTVRDASLSLQTVLAGREAVVEVQAGIGPFDVISPARIRSVSARLLPDPRSRQWLLSADDESAAETRFTTHLPIPADLRSGLYHIEVRAEDDLGLIYPYSDLPLTVLPAGDLPIIDESLPPGTDCSGGKGRQEPPLHRCRPCISRVRSLGIPR